MVFEAHMAQLSTLDICFKKICFFEASFSRKSHSPCRKKKDKKDNKETVAQLSTLQTPKSGPIINPICVYIYIYSRRVRLQGFIFGIPDFQAFVGTFFFCYPGGW